MGKPAHLSDIWSRKVKIWSERNIEILNRTTSLNNTKSLGQLWLLSSPQRHIIAYIQKTRRKRKTPPNATNRVPNESISNAPLQLFKIYTNLSSFPDLLRGQHGGLKQCRQLSASLRAGSPSTPAPVPRRAFSQANYQCDSHIQ